MYVISEEGMSTHTPAAPECRALQMQWGTSQQTAATSDLQPEFCENVQRKLKISSLLLPRTLALMAGPEEVSRAEQSGLSVEVKILEEREIA